MTAFGFAAVAVLLLGALVARNSALDPRHADGLTSSAGLLMFLGVVVVVAAIGGRIPAFLTAAAALAVVDWYLIPPYGSFAIAWGADAEYLVAFVVTACVVAVVVEQAARRRVEALRSRGEADVVLALADRLVRPNPPQVVVDEIHRHAEPAFRRAARARRGRLGGRGLRRRRRSRHPRRASTSSCAMATCWS